MIPSPRGGTARRPRPEALLAVLAFALAAACDGNGASSTFPVSLPIASSVEGAVFFGPAPAEGVLVKLGAESRLTDAAGAFRFDGVPARYDLVVEEEPGAFVVLPGLSQRIVNVPIQRAPKRGDWTSMVRVTLEAPVAAGHGTSVLMSGLGVRDVTGPLDRLTVRYGPEFITPARVHVVETPGGDLPGRFLAYGDAAVTLSGGAEIPTRVRLEPVRETREVDLAATMPAGYALEAVRVSYDLGGGLTRRPLLAAFAVPARVTLPRIPGFFTARITMRLGDAIADSGVTLIGDGPRTDLFVHAPAALARPEAGAEVTLGTAFEVSREGGVVEHELSPVSGGGPRVRVVTDQAAVEIPWRALGVTPKVGASYTWRVRRLASVASILTYGFPDLHRDAAQPLSGARALVMRVEPPDAGAR